MQLVQAPPRTIARSQPHQAVVDCVLDALTNGHAMPSLAPQLEQFVRDKTFWPGLRTEALQILVNYAESEKKRPRLTGLLAEIDSNYVEDPEDELLGTLLQALYPNFISPTVVWKYFRRPKSEGLM